MDERLKALLFPRALCLGCDEPREIDAGAGDVQPRPLEGDGRRLWHRYTQTPDGPTLKPVVSSGKRGVVTIVDDIEARGADSEGGEHD